MLERSNNMSARAELRTNAFVHEKKVKKDSPPKFWSGEMLSITASLPSIASGWMNFATFSVSNEQSHFADFWQEVKAMIALNAMNKCQVFSLTKINIKWGRKDNYFAEEIEL